uniref:Vacuolar protein 8 n=1 Tax=Hanusia phi TaxID=3032 RepID=A0A7S0I4C6_9CRYP
MMTQSDEYQKCFSEDAAAITSILRLCESGTDKAKKYACLMVALLASDSSNQKLLGRTQGLLPALVDLANDDELSDECRANVAWALGSLANENDENRCSIGRIPEAPNALVKIASCPSEEARERAAYCIAEVVRDNDDNKLLLGSTEGSVAALVHICATGSDPGKEQAAWALAMLAENSGDNCDSIVLTPFALEALLDMISSPDDEGDTDKIASANALYAIAELARSGPGNRAAIVDTEGMLEALQLVSSSDIPGHQVAQWALDQLLSDYDDDETR